MKKSKNNLTIEERVLQHLLTKIKLGTNNCTYFEKKDVETLNISDKEAMFSLSLLQTDNLLFISRCPSSKDFTMSWSITLNSNGIHYFENKEAQKKNNFTQSLQYWINTGLSIIAIIISIIALILTA